MARAKNAMRSSGPQMVTMAGVEWEEQYGCYTARLNGWMELSVAHVNGAYRIRVAGRALELTSKTPEGAASRAVEVAYRMARGIVDLLEGAE